MQYTKEIVDRSQDQMTYNGQKYIFLKVALDKKVGWVWGDPAIITSSGDE